MLDNLVDNKKWEKYNEHITRLENLFKSVIIVGNYEEYRLAPCLMLFNFIDLLRGVTILDSNHMVISGNIIIRSMFEILLDFLYCETNRKLYLRFGEYQDVNRVLLYKSVPQNIKDKVDKENYNNITVPNFEEFKFKYNIKNDKKEMYEYFDNLLKEINIEYRTTTINFAHYPYIIFASAKIMEMDSFEQNKVALYLFNTINSKIKNCKNIGNTKQTF